MKEDIGEILFKVAVDITRAYAAGLKVGLEVKEDKPKLEMGFQPPEKEKKDE